MTNTVISYPIPAYANVPIRPEFYEPSQFPITAIALGVTTTVTMGNSTNNVAPNYVVGQLVRFTIPNKYGTRGLNEKSGLVISIPSATQVEVDIDSNGFDPFIASPTFIPFESRTLPQIMAIGDINNGAINATGRRNTGTFIPGSFIDISPA